MNEWKKHRIYFAFRDANDNIGKKVKNKSQTNGESVALFVHSIEKENEQGISKVYWMIPCDSRARKTTSQQIE